MRTIIAVLATLVLVSAVPVMAQEGPPRYVNESYLQISFADVDEWNAIYREHIVPVLQELQDEGMLEGWFFSSHQTGGSYNYRLAFRFYDWASIMPFFDAYFARLTERAPDALERTGHMIMSHEDEIWEISDVHVSEDGPPIRYLYASVFQVSLADMDEFNQLYEEVWTPVLTDLVSEGLLNGWVVLNHAFGGRHNWKILYFCEEWDKIDDFFQSYLGRLREQHPAEFEKAGRMVVSHRDNLWVPVPAQESDDDT